MCFQYILSIIDCYSKFAWTVPLKTKTARFAGASIPSVLTVKCSGVADGLRKVFNNYGWPQIVQSDNGSEFRGEVEEVNSLVYLPGFSLLILWMTRLSRYARLTSGTARLTLRACRAK